MNLSRIAYMYLTACKIVVSRNFLEQKMKSHYNYPALVSFTDTLDELGLGEYDAVHAEAKHIPQFSFPFLAQTPKAAGGFEIVPSLEYYETHKEEFLNRWEGIAVMKYLFFFCITIFISCAGTTNTNPPSKEKSSEVIIIQAQLPAKSKFYLNGFDSLYRNSTLTFLNRSDKDSIITKIIYSSKAIIYTFYGGESGSEKIPFLVSPGDTIKLNFNNNNFSRANYKNPHCLLNYFPQQTLQTSFGETNLANTDKKELINKLSNIEKTYISRNTLIDEMAKDEKTDSSFIELLRKYNKIYKYNDICKLNFDQRTDTSVFYKQLAPYYKEIKNSFSFFDAIQCNESKQILYRTIMFDSWANSPMGTNIWNRLSHSTALRPSSNYLDGFFYDLLKNDPSLTLLSDRKTALQKVMPFLKNKEIFKDLVEYPQTDLPGYITKVMLEDVNGNSLNLNEILKGNEKIVILDFWASWCVPCLMEMPSMKKAEKQFEGKIKFIKISLDENRSKWKEAMAKNRLLKYSYFNSVGSESPMNGYFNLTSIPRYVVLTNSGKLIFKDFLRPSEINFKTELDNILKMNF